MPRSTTIKKASSRARRGGGTEVALPAAAPSTAGAPSAAPVIPQTPYEVTYRYGSPSQGIVQNNGADWFGPLNPLSPIAPNEVAGRRMDFPSGYNLNVRPRSYEAVTFDMMRALADGYDLMRIVIETRKDQMAALDWNVVPRDRKQKIAGAIADRVAKVEAFFLRPDKVNFWDTWIRMVLEDLFVIDAPSLHVRRTLGGDLYSIEQIDGGTVKRVIDDWGRTPEPPVAAYQQVLKGYPAVNYTAHSAKSKTLWTTTALQELIYRPRNQRVHKVYGYSPVEQVIMTVNIALRRQVFQLNYFTEGTVPEALIGVPDTWTPDQIRQFQDWFDSVLTGNLAERRRARFVPSAMAKTYVETKQGELFGAAEEWFAKVICFAFSISAQPFMKMMNRASAETAQEVALEEGLAPIQKWVKALIDSIIIDEFGFDDIEFKWADTDELDPAAQSKILTDYTGKGIMTLNEARGDLGLDPYDDPNFNKPMVVTATGYVFVSPSDQAEVSGQPNSPPAAPDPNAIDPLTGGPKGQQSGVTQIGGPTHAKPGAGGGSTQDPSVDAKAKAGQEAADDEKSGKIAKSAYVPPDPNRPVINRAKTSLQKTMIKQLSSVGSDVATQVEKALQKIGKAKKATDDIDVDSLVASLDLSTFEDGADDMQEDLETVAADSGRRAIAQLGMDRTSFNAVNDRATAWSKQHVAMLVGKSKNPKYALTDDTRDMVRAVITDGLGNGLTSTEVADQLQASFAFSPERAANIADTEIRRANSAGAVEGFKAARDLGVDVQKEWLLGDEACDECQENADAGPIDLDDTFPSGDDESPAHPHCNCSISPVVATDSGDGEGEDDDE